MSSRGFGAVRPVVVLVIGLLSLTWFVAMAVPAAFAAPKGVVDTFGLGELTSATGLAVNDTTGDVYVLDPSASGARRFASDGTLLGIVGGTQGSLGGETSQPHGVAVDQGDGSVWITDVGNSRVQRYDPLLLGLHPFGLALGWDVVDGGGTEFEVCTPADTCKAGARGSGDGQFGGFAFDNIGEPAVDTTRNDVFVADPVNGRVQRFDAATGAYETQFGSGTFGAASPGRLEVDSHGAVYAIDAANDRVVRCAPLADPDEYFCTTFAGDVLSGVEAFDIAIDATDDHIYVVRRPPQEGLFPDQTPIDIIELEPDGDVVEIHARHRETAAGPFVSDGILFEAFLTGRTGLEVDSTTGRIYLIVPDNFASQVLVFGDAPEVRESAGATIQAASAVDATSATLHGLVDPKGHPTSYRFEYRAGTAPWSTIPGAPVPVGAAPGDVPVSENLAGLQPDTTYQVRVVAVRPWGPGSATSPTTTFTTEGVAPEVSGERAAADDTSAALEARVDANNNPTTYHFEYGLTTSYGQETPARDGGEGPDPVRRTERVTGLQPGTTYHYRVLATNAFGTTEGPDRTFTTDAAPPAPDGRAYELVTPAGGVADMRPNNGGWRPSTPDGNHVCIGSAFDIGGSDPTGGTQTDDAYCAHRGEGGWTIEWVAQPRGAPLPPQSPIVGASVRWITDDGARKIWTSDIKGVVPERPPARSETSEGYLRAGGQTQWVTPVSPLVEGERHPLAASKDLSHVVYLEDLTPDIFWDNATVLWEWVEGSGARRVTMTGAGAPATGTANLDGASSPFGSGMWALPTTVSDDGSRIFFESDDALVPGDAATTDVYVREDGTTTRLLSERRGPASTEGASFAGASEDGEVAYIRTTGQLTADAKVGTAVYRYTLATDALELVEDDIGSTLAVSADGSSIVFTGTNVLGPADGASLYINRDGTTTRIAPLPFGNTSAHLVAASNHTQRALRMTADGSVVVFRASTPDPGLPAVHRWEAGEGLTTVSVDQDGNAVAAGFGNLGFTVGNVDINAGRGMTDDGETVFFDTEETLSARDVNGDGDVYAWRDGRVRLISPGADPDGDARYLDNSADGSTVFFTTYEQVLPRQDDNTARDLYAARVGGGFPEPPPITIGDPPPPQPPADPPPPTAPPSAGDGDQAHDPRPEVSAATPNAAARRAAARTGRLPLRIVLTGGGKVTVRATAVVAGKRRTVASASRTVRRARRTPVRLELQLSQAARRELRRRGRLSLRIAVNGARVLDDVQLTVVLRRSTGGR